MCEALRILMKPELDESMEKGIEKGMDLILEIMSFCIEDMVKLKCESENLCKLSLYINDLGQMLRGEFYIFLPLLRTTQQFSVLQSLCTIPHHSIFHMFCMFLG